MSALIDMSKFGQVPSVFASDPSLAGDELSAGIVSSLGVVSYRGKVWRVKYRKVETDLLAENGIDPRPSIEVVILKAGSSLSKMYYPNGYSEDSSEAPTCWSSNGVKPDANVPENQRVHSACATCPMNVFGSRVTPDGKQVKACSDSKRLAVVPLQDIDNAAYGGPMKLSIPAGSLGDLSAYDNLLKSVGFPYAAVGTRIGFDISKAYPKLAFSAIRPLTEEEARKVVELRNGPDVARILNETPDVVENEPEQPTVASVFEQPPVAQPKPVVQPKAAVQPKTAAPVAQPKPVVQPKAAAPAAQSKVSNILAQAAPAAVERKPLEKMTISEQIAASNADEASDDVDLALEPEDAAGPTNFDAMLDDLLSK